ncbi:MAG: hypothetical protein QOJ88_1026 [Pyrinomonadaceae bacterium]|jgi:hypothetical protein|nr:hypothetical protein [Pyrinomonadaceae bacterium]MDQ1728129.1 hypothetical protein [Pyrinomonadaceae bacterium]
MNEKMQVLFAKQTGHVLAAFTRTADSENKPKVVAATGGGLVVRQPTLVTALSATIQEMIVPAEALDLSVVDFDSAVFGSPREYVEGGGKIAKLGPDTLLSVSTPPPASSPTTLVSSPEVSFSTTRLAIQIPTNTADEKGVCVILEEKAPLPGVAPERRVAQGKIATGTHFISLDWKTSPDGSPVSVPSGSYFVLALLAGCQPLFRTITL